MTSSSARSAHQWRFFRAGGFDQVHLQTGADLAHLADLDQKLWVALSCPTKGVEFDRATLALVDTDADGHVRAPELLAALSWAFTRLTSPDVLMRGGELALSDISAQSEEGARLRAAAQRILASLGKPEATHISVADAADSGRIFSGMPCNGDGVITAAALDERAAGVFALIASTLGTVPERCGEPGLNRALIERFFAEGAALRAWRQDGRATVEGLDGQEASAYEALIAVKDKVDDYFRRCRLAEFDPRAAGLLNGSEDDLRRIGAQLLTQALDGEVGALPLAYVRSGASLPLTEQLNPAWAPAVQALRDRVVQPILGERAELSEAEWTALQSRFEAYGAWRAAQPDTPLHDVPVETLDAALDGGAQEPLLAQVAQDEAAAEEAALIGDVERLTRYVRDLAALCNNFVAFKDFYTRQGKATFQAGTLYMDGRSCELTVKVLDPARHAALAGLSGAFLAYCDCVRKGEKMTIAAAFTAGDSEQLMVGRNGVFYDRDGRDWDATIVKVVDHPISIRQAFWTPYRKVARLIGEQIEKFTASKAQASTDFTTQAVTKAGDKVTTAPAAGAPAAAPAPVDAARFAGIFAAVGLAIGAIGTALAALVTGFLGLQAWQMPLALLGLIALISGPSMLMAYFKLRKRNLGPILDANGWAVNTRARINIAFGTALTQRAELPEGAERSVVDPFADQRTPWKRYVLLVSVVAGGLAWAWWSGNLMG
ncbi:hypothetical protein WNB94_04455 [Aquabacterium sp. A3]|uniref:hypothetical protein n=1 Tax=Aquabacterium sp. A3 TaxID=3132829 RepID=UPI00311A6F89